MLPRSVLWRSICLAGALAAAVHQNGDLRAGEPAAEALQSAVKSAKSALIKAQEADGSWRPRVGDDTYTIGTTSLALLALLNSEMNADDPAIQRSLTWLRQQDPILTKEIALMIQALAAAKAGDRDVPKVTALVRGLEETQVREGPNTGSWPYSKRVRPVGTADHCNCYFAIMGLYAAHEIGVSVDIETWRRARDHWLSSQNSDGSWAYKEGNHSADGTGSMTAAGVTALVVTQSMVQSAE